jgi:hypothetical protein
VAREKTREEKLFAAAVLRRSFELQDGQYREQFEVIYRGVLRDLDLEEPAVEEYLAAHRQEIEDAIGRRGRAT